VKVVNGRHHITSYKDVNIARPSALGNPYSHLSGTLAKYQVADRNEAIEKYRVWLEKAITDPDEFGHEAVVAAMKMITEDSILVCWCKPKKCHGEVVIEMWRKYFSEEQPT
jgi:hypothetical protein